MKQTAKGRQNVKLPANPTTLCDILKRAWKDYEKHGGIPHQEFWKALGKEVRRS